MPPTSDDASPPAAPPPSLLREDLSLAALKLRAVTALLPTVTDAQGNHHPAITTSRGSQLDAESLDDEVVRTLRLQADKIALLLGRAELARFGPEVDALLRLLLWGASTRINAPTPGQALQNLRYRNEAAFAAPHLAGVRTLPGDNPTRQQRALSLLLVVLVPYLWTRARELALDLEDWRADLVDKLDRAWRIISLLHFLVFIYNSRYRSFADRLAGMRLVPASNEAVRSVMLDLVNQQLFFDGFVELMVCLVPAVDISWLRRIATRLYRGVKRRVLAITGLTPAPQSEACVSCGTDPAVMRHVSSCGHSWCYYCIKLDSSGVCPGCGLEVTSAERV